MELGLARRQLDRLLERLTRFLEPAQHPQFVAEAGMSGSRFRIEVERLAIGRHRLLVPVEHR